jgi:transcriptional regulator with XRE-family HTH domain
MDPDKAVRFGKYLKQQRQAKGLSSRALARAVGANDATIVRIERGTIESPRPNLLSAIARELDLPLSDVFAYADYVVPQELPSFTPYLRAKYGELPPEAVEQLERSFARLAKKYGADTRGPTPGQDEE